MKFADAGWERRRVALCALLALSLVSACASVSKMTETQKVEAMAVQYTAAWCSQKPDAVAAHYAATGLQTARFGMRAARAVLFGALQQNANALYSNIIVRN